MTMFRFCRLLEMASCSYISQENATSLDKALMETYSFSIDQLMEIAGLSVAQAVARCYPPPAEAKPTVLLCCGPGNNGGDGLVAARHLLTFGYEPQVFYPKRPDKRLYHILVAQCEKLQIKFLSQLPPASDIDLNYHVTVDALFGFGFKGSPRAPFDSVLSTLHATKRPLCSVDVPSGWDVEKGDTVGSGLRPDLLVSLTAPKPCAKYFSGTHHYLGMRMVPQELASQFQLVLPSYPGAEQIVRLS